jgi:auxin influx carrier (AUX1 LAX family)
MAALEQNSVEKPPFFLPSWAAMYILNIFIVVWVAIVGFGFGGWASMTNFVEQVGTFGLFAKCYQCPPRVPPLATGVPTVSPKLHAPPPHHMG